MKAVDEVIADANRALMARLSNSTVQKRAA